MGSLLLRNLSKKSPEWCPIIKRNQKTNGHPVQIMRHRIANNTIQEGSWSLSTERRNAKEQLEIERDCMESKKRRPILWGVLRFFIRKR